MIVTMSGVDATIQEMLRLAGRLATDAAAIARSHAGQIRSARKPDDSLVTETDHTIQSHILKVVANAYPDHAVRAEETTTRPDTRPRPAEARYCWVVDPLDGTRNYVAGFPCYSTSIAVLDEGRPVVGVVFEHNLELLYTAAAGSGASLNGAPVRVTEPKQDADMLVGTPSSKDRLTVSVLRHWAAMPGLICRNLGSTALHLGLVASGALSAAFCKRSKIWDIAAGALLVSEAGGRITDLTGTDLEHFDLSADPDADVPFLAAAPGTHHRLIPSIRRIAEQS